MLMMFFSLYDTESKHEDQTDMPDLLYMPRSQGSMVTATKKIFSLVKEVFKKTPWDY